MAPFSFTSGGGGGGAAASNDDWTRVDVTDGTWTKNDPDTTASSITNSGGVNSVGLDTTGQSVYIDGCTWYKELKTVDGSDFDFTDAPVDFRAYVHLPDIGWADDSGNTGGNNNPPTASKCYCLVGITTDPANLPSSGATPVPRDILAAGLESTTNVNRLKRQIIRNVSNSGTHGVINTNSAWLDLISSADVSAGHKASNRFEWQTEIVKSENLSAGSLDPAGAPRSYYLISGDRWDNGDRRTVNSYAADQRWGRGGNSTQKLYVFVCVGRNAAASTAITMKFDVYYHARLLDGGTSPSGKTGLPS